MADPVGRSWTLADRGDGRGDMFPVVAGVFYVSAAGDDAGSGSAAQPWQTIARVNAQSFVAGSEIRFRAGDTFDDAVLQPQGDNLLISSYDAGAQPIIRQAVFNSCPGSVVDGIDFDHNGGTARVLDVQHSFVVQNCKVHDGSQRDGIAIRNCPDGAFIQVINTEIYWMLAGSFGTNDDAHGVSVRPGVGETITVELNNCVIHENSGDCIQCDPDRAAGFTANINVNGGTWYTQPLAQNKYGWNAGERPGEDGFDTKVDETVPTPTSVINLNVVNLETYGWLTANSPHSNPTPYNLKERVVADLNRLNIYDCEHALRIRLSNRGGAISQPDVQMRNSIIRDVDNALRVEDGNITNLEFYNNTFGLGINNFVQKAGGDFGAGFDARNNAFAGTKPADFTDASNVSADTADGVDFFEPSQNNYRPVAGGALENTGVDLSGIVFFDFTGATRAQTPGGWEIGAYDGAVQPVAPGDFGFYEALVARPGLVFRADLSTLGGNGPLDAAAADAQIASYGSSGPTGSPRASYSPAFDAAEQVWVPPPGGNDTNGTMANTKPIEFDNEFDLNPGSVTTAFVYWESRFDESFCNLDRGIVGAGSGNSAWGDPTGLRGVGGSADGYMRGFKGYTFRDRNADKVFEVRVQGNQYKDNFEETPPPALAGEQTEAWVTGGVDIRQYPGARAPNIGPDGNLDGLETTVAMWPNTWTRWFYFFENFNNEDVTLTLWKSDPYSPPVKVYDQVPGFIENNRGLAVFVFEVNTSELQNFAGGGPWYEGPGQSHYGRTFAIVDDVPTLADAQALVDQASLHARPPVWSRHTIDLYCIRAATFANPFLVEVDFTFTHTQSSTVINRPGYFAGLSGTAPTGKYSCDFMPTLEGEWTWTTSSAEPTLNNAQGSLIAVTAQAGQRGLLRPNGTRFQRSDGTYLIPNGVLIPMEFETENVSDAEFTTQAEWLAQNGVTHINWRLCESDVCWENQDPMTRRFRTDWTATLQRRFDILRDLGIGSSCMFYSDDGGAPGFGGQTDTELQLIRYFVAAFGAYPYVMIDSGIDISEYRSDADIEWWVVNLQALDDYDHVISSRHGGGSGSYQPAAQTYNSGGQWRTEISHWENGESTTVPSHNNDNFTESDVPDPNPSQRPGEHTPDDLRRGAWKGLAALDNFMCGFNARHFLEFQPVGKAEAAKMYTMTQGPNNVVDEYGAGVYIKFLNQFLLEELGAAYAELNIDQPVINNGAGGKWAKSSTGRDRIVVLCLGVNDTYDSGDGGSVTVDLQGETGTWTARWLNPRTYAFTSAGTAPGNAETDFTPPSNDDWILYLEKQ